MHEASLYENNCFITLTYSDEYLPQGYHLRSDPGNPTQWVFKYAPGSIDIRHPTEFMYKLRKKFGKNIRSFGCAEYGEKLKRPHYHICIFNHNFLDRKPYKEYKLKDETIKLDVSEELQRLWGKGHTTVGDLTFESAAYTARYVTKKITGERAKAHYEEIDFRTGEISQRLPERPVCVSRRPGIGSAWYERNSGFIQFHDFVVLRGKRVRPAKYYDRIYDRQFPSAFKDIKERRREDAFAAANKTSREDSAGYAQFKLNRDECAPYDGASYKTQIEVKETILELNMQRCKRGFENG